MTTHGRNLRSRDRYFQTRSRKPEIVWLGSKDSGMVLINASTDERKGIANLLRELNAALQRETVRKRLDDLIAENDNSVRLIQAGRYEIFVHVEGKGSLAFDELTRHMPRGAKTRILNYAVKTASHDPRLKNSNVQYDFENFSLIATYEGVPAQAPHIDVIFPNYQFGLMVTDNSPGTQFFESSGGSIRSTDALVTLWAGIGGELGMEFPPNLAIAMRADPVVRDLIRSFGDVLMPAGSFEKMVGCEKLPAGSILSLPGNVVHAGPHSTCFRCILFYSAKPTRSEGAPYDADDQYSAVTLSGHMVHLLWRQPNIEYEERLFLLTMLVKYISESTVSGMNSHFPEGELCDFIRCIEASKYPDALSRKDYIESVAQNKNFCPRHCQFVEDEKVDAIISLEELEKLSVSDLVTKWKGEPFDVTVYRRRDGSIFLHYPTASDPGTGRACCEGVDDGDHFTLKMDDSEDALFDGSNGTLLDSWQRPIRCFRRSTMRPRNTPSPSRSSPRIKVRGSDANRVEQAKGEIQSEIQQSSQAQLTFHKKMETVARAQRDIQVEPGECPSSHLSNHVNRRTVSRPSETLHSGHCDACMVDDYSKKCDACKDMLRFAGMGRLRRRCKHRPSCRKLVACDFDPSAIGTYQSDRNKPGMKKAIQSAITPKATNKRESIEKNVQKRTKARRVSEELNCTSTACLRRRTKPRPQGSLQCGRCDDCMVDDCATCIACVDMVKFGGKGRLKQRCKHRPLCKTAGVMNPKR